MSLFDFNDQRIRVVELNGEPWFVVADVLKVLGLTNPSYVCQRLAPDERASFKLGERGVHANCISESGLYKLIMRSDKPQAKAFQDWVTKEVLPSIRKTGSYVTGTVC